MEVACVGISAYVRGSSQLYQSRPLWH